MIHGKVLVAITLLNKTSGKLGIPAFFTLISKWLIPLELYQGTLRNHIILYQSILRLIEVIALIRHLGTQSVRF